MKYDSKFVEAWILLGDVHIGLGDKLNGIEAYKKSIPIAPRFSYPMYYRLASAEYSIGEYSQALKHIRKYLTFKNTSEKHRKKALAIKKSCEFSISAMNSPVSFNPENLGVSINSNADDIYRHFQLTEVCLFFTRSENVNGTRNEDFYLSYHNTDEWGLAENLGKPITRFKMKVPQCITADGKNALLYSLFSTRLLR